MALTDGLDFKKMRYAKEGTCQEEIDLFNSMTDSEKRQYEEDLYTPMCGRCYEQAKVFPANCLEKPEDLIGQPLGMYHCPDCGAMVIAGIPHPPLCKICLDRKHPGIDCK